MLVSNCHTHTVFCDGKNTPEEMVLAALRCGFQCLGFSFHGPMRGDPDWAIEPAQLPAYRAEIRRLQTVYGDRIEILDGIELDACHRCVLPEDYDYVIASVHVLEQNGKSYELDDTPDVLRGCCEEAYGGDWLNLAAAYYESVADFVCAVDPTIVGHLDIIEKFNEGGAMFDTNDPAYQAIACAAVDRILQSCPDVLFEVNTGAMARLGKRYPYPAAFLLSYLFKKGARVIITSDSHSVDTLDFAFDKALQLVKDAGFSEVYELRRRDGKCSVEPIVLS